MIDHRRARAYNQAQRHPLAVHERLALAMGRQVSGWSDADLDTIAAWQAAQGLTPDGMVGPRTVAALPALPAPQGAPLIAVSPAAGGGGYDHAYDPSDPSRGGWPKVDPQWDAVTATGSWLAGMLRLLTGRQERRGVATYSRGPDDFISLDTYSLGIAHWWADTAPSKLLAPLASRFAGEADAAWGRDGAAMLRDPARLRQATGTTRGHGRFNEGRLRWLLNGWWAVARRPHWLAAQVEAWAQDYIGEALDVARGAGVRWDSMTGEERGKGLAGIARMCNSSPALARTVVRRYWGGRGSLVAALERGYAVERPTGYSKGGNGPRRWAAIEAMCAADPGEAIFGARWADAVAQGLDMTAAPERARGV